MPTTKFWLNPTYHSRANGFWRFSNGRPGNHLGYWNRAILEILNLYVLPMPPTKFRLNPTHGLGGDVVWRILRWPLWRPFWILKRNDFINFESPCLPQYLPQSFGLIRLTVWKQMSFEDFQDGHHGGPLWYRNETILAILNLHVAPTPPTKFWRNLTYHSGADAVWRFTRWPSWRPSWTSKRNACNNSEFSCRPMHPTKFRLKPTYRSWADVVCRFSRWSPDGHLGYRNGTILAILNLHVPLMPPIKFQLNPTYRSGGDDVWRISRWLPWRLFWISEWNNISNTDSQCHPNASHQLSAQSELPFRRCRKCEKLRTDDGRTTDNRQRHKLNWSKAPGELITI